MTLTDACVVFAAFSQLLVLLAPTCSCAFVQSAFVARSPVMWTGMKRHVPVRQETERSKRRGASPTTTGTTRFVGAGGDDIGGGGDGDGGGDDMRRLLEASWNADTMGQVPTDAETAADAAAGSILSAMNREEGSSSFFVDILLPQYDVARGSNLYDEVLAVEFCVELSNRMEGKSCIVVRDDKTLDVVNRIFNARRGVKEPSASTAAATAATTPPPESETNVRKVEYFDDFADFGEIGGDGDGVGGSDRTNEPTNTPAASSPSSSSDAEGVVSSSSSPSSPTITTTSDAGTSQNDDVDSFRKQLMSQWDGPGDDESDSKSNTDDASSQTMSSSSPAEVRDGGDDESSSFASESPVAEEPCDQYRLVSMLGDSSQISAGPDMTDDVIKSVASNALPRDDEMNLIVLSAVSREELVGVRALAAKYRGSKNVVLVNCKLDPLPRELISAQTVYHVMPLIAKPARPGGGIFSSSSSSSTSRKDDEGNDEEEIATKVVLLRRYPRDWEVHVDVGRGFELAATAPAGQVEKRGPPMEWIAGCVKRYLQQQT